MERRDGPDAPFPPSEVLDGPPGAALGLRGPSFPAGLPRDAEELLPRGGPAPPARPSRSALGRVRPPVPRPLGTLRHWEQARATAPDFAVAYVRVIMRDPNMVAAAVA